MAVAIPIASLLIAAGSTAYSATESHNQAVEAKDNAKDQIASQKAIEDERHRRELEVSNQQAALAASRSRAGQQKSGYSNKDGTVLTGQLGAAGPAPTAVRTALGA